MIFGACILNKNLIYSWKASVFYYACKLENIRRGKTNIMAYKLRLAAGVPIQIHSDKIALFLSSKLVSIFLLILGYIFVIYV